MAPTKPVDNNHSSNHYGEDVARKANILASCYLVDSSAASLKGLHYCTTGVTGAECPPLAAITPTNQLALTPKAKKSSTTRGNGRVHNRRGGAALRIREECERFFCETLRAMFLGERNSAPQHSVLTGVFYNDYGNPVSDAASALRSGGSLPPTPPDDYPIGNSSYMASQCVGHKQVGSIGAWLEIWDYAGGSSFRAFLAEDAAGEDKTLFVFFDAHVLGRDLKQALVALIELAEGPLDCNHMVICIDRSIPGDDSKALTRGLQWAGFSLTTLDFWASDFDVISNRWIFMGMEL
ncbi:ornithine decarboxylase antizyme-domain-containing protein [Echria macrotheca]|uniref:Ornithine decarboxylase antizyme n=1 Tax=Echria macrotheca TaxID=438768 RepID=A0AAJ0BF38_9PEZI|nr:ornithine decarboxylase antizyme-domain-containing protein [Echria macrotheca]